LKQPWKKLLEIEVLLLLDGKAIYRDFAADARTKNQ